METTGVEEDGMKCRAVALVLKHFRRHRALHVADEGLADLCGRAGAGGGYVEGGGAGLGFGEGDDVFQGWLVFVARGHVEGGHVEIGRFIRCGRADLAGLAVLQHALVSVEVFATRIGQAPLKVALGRQAW